jgi:hypothetical protein
MNPLLHRTVEIVEDLQAAVAQFAEIANDLKSDHTSTNSHRPSYSPATEPRPQL